MRICIQEDPLAPVDQDVRCTAAPLLEATADPELPGALPTLPELLRGFRRREGLSMQAASALVGVGRTVWRTWENAGVVPSPDNLALLATVLEVTPAQLRRVAGPDLVRRAHDCPCGLPHGLSALRIRAGLTSRQLARRLHVSPSTITHWESGDRACGWQDRLGIAAALGISREQVDAALGPLAPYTPFPCPGLRHRRAAAGMSRGALAQQLGVDPATIRRWERRGVAPVSHLADLQALLGPAVLEPPPRSPVAERPPLRPLARLREASGLPVAVVAARVGVSPGSVYSWERGTRTPDWHHLRRLARVYRRPAAELFAAAGVPGPRLLRPPPWEDRELPALLVELRRWAGHTQDSLARTLGVHASTVASWERGRNVPSARAREALAGWVED